MNRKMNGFFDPAIGLGLFLIFSGFSYLMRPDKTPDEIAVNTLPDYFVNTKVVKQHPEIFIATENE